MDRVYTTQRTKYNTLIETNMAKNGFNYKYPTSFVVRTHDLKSNVNGFEWDQSSKNKRVFHSNLVDKGHFAYL